MQAPPGDAATEIAADVGIVGGGMATFADTVYVVGGNTAAVGAGATPAAAVWYAAAVNGEPNME